MEQSRPIYSRLLQQSYRLYYDGFRQMTLGRTLWKIIIIKLIIFFGVLKVFFFQDFLGTKFHNDTERAEYVATQLIRPHIQTNNTVLIDKEEVNHD